MTSVIVESALNKGRFVNVLKWMAVAATVVSGSVFSQGVLAACTFTGTLGHEIDNPESVTLDGTVPYIDVTASGSSSALSCLTTGPISEAIDSEYVFRGAGTGGNYESGIPGLALYIHLMDPLLPQGPMGDLPLSRSRNIFGRTYPIEENVVFRISFMQVGEIPSAGGVISNSVLLAKATQDGNVFFQARFKSPLTIKLPRPTCTATSSPTMTLDEVSSADFDPNGRAKPTDFNIDLSCTGRGTTDVSVTLTDANSPGNTGATLTAAAGSDAEGIALEIHKGSGSSSPVQFGSKWLALPGTSEGNHSIPLSVNYLKNGPLKSGEVKAGMTYTLDYE